MYEKSKLDGLIIILSENCFSRSASKSSDSGVNVMAIPANDTFLLSFPAIKCFVNLVYDIKCFN